MTTTNVYLEYTGFEYALSFQFIYQAAYDDSIFKSVYSALSECGKGWSCEYGEPEEKFNEYITIMLRRFSDVRMKDPCIRICREPLRKLSRNERFVGPALTALKHHINPNSIIVGIKSVLKYDYTEDEQAVELQKMLRLNGLKYVLKNVCGLSEGDPLYDMIAE